MKRRQPQKIGNDIYGVKSALSLKQKPGDTGESEFRHSDHYHKYFHGYTEVRREKANGKYEIERIYTADWYVQDVSISQYWIIRILYLALALLSGGLYFLVMTRPGFAGNLSPLVAIPGFAEVICLILLLASLLAYTVTKRKMTWWSRQAGPGRVRRYALASAITLGLTAVCIVVNAVPGAGSLQKELLLAGAVGLCALACLAIFAVEKRIPYKEEKNDTVLPGGEQHQIW